MKLYDNYSSDQVKGTVIFRRQIGHTVQWAYHSLWSE